VATLLQTFFSVACLQQNRFFPNVSYIVCLVQCKLQVFHSRIGFALMVSILIALVSCKLQSFCSRIGFPLMVSILLDLVQCEQ
jgi:hypothetical protein